MRELRFLPLWQAQPAGKTLIFILVDRKEFFVSLFLFHQNCLTCTDEENQYPLQGVALFRTLFLPRTEELKSEIQVKMKFVRLLHPNYL